ncbi:lipocalin-like domain-containing protein [Adhaeribacter pallidiroseus]|uniref:Lipocalin-like domain-containing protein n=1 Tax=Adhaeribacter pallidiroseus TaxID=2072847 RepID=A0A369QUQ6_9BACT|nr:lipocalin family protein [Adhaeribacter pallidiroseus]RDC66519.1 hypothetical protein AHMF7616_05150 [Adhaeribacter pallidiroseus]
MKNVKLLPVLFIVLLTFNACDKDDDDSKTQTKAELIADKNWVLTAYTSKENNDPVVDEFVYYDACEKDDVLRFSKNGTYEVNEGATKCNSADPQVSENGTWSITDDTLALTEAGSSLTNNAKINELSKSKLVISATQTYQNETYVETYTFLVK